MPRIRSAYGAQIVDVEPLAHPRGHALRRVTWRDEAGETRAAKTFPGGDANRQADHHPRDVPARIIVNGRGQIVHIEPHTD